MSDKAEAALAAWYDQKGNEDVATLYNDDGTTTDVSWKTDAAFFAGYAAASAETERLVRAAIEATIEEAVNIADSGYILPLLDADADGHYGYPVTVNTEQVAAAIRERIDAAAIAARVMQEVKAQ